MLLAMRKCKPNLTAEVNVHGIIIKYLLSHQWYFKKSQIHSNIGDGISRKGAVLSLSESVMAQFTIYNEQ